ncbi:MAG: TIGR00282 family metallophosphoesterase [Firmicutes bacterium HGW-Firmicutes-21]|nr:MAG: TIGR00282 family metallophosphoesterase [Firmicutes bacterium HGW-Firmicutes-21]
MRIIAIGDVVGSNGTEYALKLIRKIRNAEKGDLVIVNAENASPGNGLDTKSAEALLGSGADVITGGNHTLRRHEVFDFLDENSNTVRPLNLPPSAPGKGFTIIRACEGLRVMVMNVLGQVFMDPADNPFTAADRLLAEQEGNYDLCICDIHAEATSEKAAFARYFDGRIQVIFGTHTHVQTADERILPKGSGFITDLGMCGPVESILGTKPEPVIKNFVTRVHDRFEAGEGEIKLCGAVFEIDTAKKCVKSVKRIKY